MSNTRPQLSVIVPIYNEAAMLRQNLEHFKQIANCAELIFVDGGSDDDSANLLRKQNFQVIESAKGRARQMNAGARRSSGRHCLFLHADTKIANNFSSCLNKISASPWGFFRIVLSRRSWPYSWIAKSINWRARVFKIATGDQGIFVDRELFNSLGAFPDIELMEDIALSRKLRKLHPPAIIPCELETSSRRWEQRGIVKTIVQMWCIQLAYKVGVRPSTLRHWYQ